MTESPSELPEPKLTSSHQDNELSPYADIVDPLKLEISALKAQLKEAQIKLQESDMKIIKDLESPDSHIEADCELQIYPEDKLDIKYGSIVPVHKASLKNGPTPVAKMAERIKLKRVEQRDIGPGDMIASDLPTAVAEHIVGDILRQCDGATERQAVEVEFRRLNGKLEHARSQNSVLALTLSETKSYCDRLALLCGKYESNAVALRLALGVCDRTIEAYDVLLALLETELALSDNVPGKNTVNTIH